MCYLTVKIRTDVKQLILLFVRKRLLLVLLCSIFSLRRSMLAEAAFGELFKAPEKTSLSCGLAADGDFIEADCSDQKYAVDVPQSLEKLKVLNLSRNYIKNITRESFEKYRDTLAVLDLSYMTKWTKTKDFVYASDSFLPLYKLEYLDLSESCYNIEFRLPNKIRKLRIENCDTIVEVFGLIRLEEFYAAGNAWKNCPQFHHLAPLRYVDLRKNNLLQFEVERIAPFCFLSTLRLDRYIPHEKIPRREHNVTTYCACMALEWWLTTTETLHDPLNCTLPDGTVAICDEKSNDQSMRLRQQCLQKIAPHVATSVETNWLLILMIILIFLFLALPVVANMIIEYLDERAQLHNKAIQKEQEEEELGENEQEEEVEEEDRIEIVEKKEDIDRDETFTDD